MKPALKFWANRMCSYLTTVSSKIGNLVLVNKMLGLGVCVCVYQCVCVCVCQEDKLIVIKMYCVPPLALLEFALFYVIL